MKSTGFASNGDIWKVGDSGPNDGRYPGGATRGEDHPPSTLAALLQNPAAVERVLKIVLNRALTALEPSSNQPTRCTKGGRCSTKPISASTRLFTILFCPPCICLLARLTERFYK